jgi:cystathionine gamma-synthase
MTKRDRPEEETEALAFETRAIHAGQEPDPATGAVSVPIYQTSLFVQDDVDRDRGWFYSRTANPTRSALERCLASLEGASHGFCFGSGLAAEDAVLRLLRPGDHLVVSRDVYGGTYRLLREVWEDGGLSFTPADLTDPDAIDAAWRDETRMVWVESPTNPRLEIIDIAAVAAVARGRDAWTVVDNTLASPYLQQPLALGADVVVHSTTKYVGGHSDVIGGFVGTSDDALAGRLRFLQNAIGAVPGPLDCFLTLRGAKTLAVRMERHSANARLIAERLSASPAVAEVIYPGLASHPGHAIAAAQMRDFGGMIAFRVRGGRPAVDAALAGTGVWTLGESLGGVESLIEHPGAMTHASLAGSGFEVPDDLIRLSVGIEHVDDLWRDLEAMLLRAEASALAPR